MSPNQASAGTFESSVLDRVQAIFAEAVRYPLEVFADIDADLENDLGIDSVMFGVVWTALRREFSITEEQNAAIQHGATTLRTLRGISALLDELATDAHTSPNHTSSKSAAPTSAIAVNFQAIAAVIAEATRYPLEILVPEARLEDDLGIDSVKWGAIVLELTRQLGAPPAHEWPSSGLATLGEVAGFIAAGARPQYPAHPAPPARAHAALQQQPAPPTPPASSAPLAREAGVSAAVLSGSLQDFRLPTGANLLERGDAFYSWQRTRREQGFWPYSRVTVSGPQTACSADDDAGRSVGGVNFASQDYLSLASHPAIKAVATEAIASFGVHSAGSSAFLGNTPMSVALERRIASFLSMEEVVLYPTGWAAGYGVIRGLIQRNDYVVMDKLAHSCLKEGANAAPQNISLFRHLDVEHCRAILQSIRSRDTQNGILVITEGLFSMDSDSPNIARFQDLCHEYGATLLVDVAHDLGCLGEDGRGHLGIQSMIGKVDLVMGSFSKTFASNGGFVATKRRAIKEYLRYFSPSATFSNALSPSQAAIVLKAFDIIDSPEGAALRRSLMRNILELRSLLKAQQFEIFGEPSAIVAVKTGDESLSRLMARRLPELGLLTNLAEYPAVEKGTARFRLQVMAKHSAWEIQHAARCMRLAQSPL